MTDKKILMALHATEKPAADHDCQMVQAYQLPGSENLPGGAEAWRLRCSVEGCAHEANAVLVPVHLANQMEEVTPGPGYDPGCPNCQKAGAHLGDHEPGVEPA